MTLLALPIFTRRRVRTGIILSGATTAFRGTNNVHTRFGIAIFGGDEVTKRSTKIVRLGKRGFMLGASSNVA